MATTVINRSIRLPRLAPMLARATETLPTDERGWAFELKWDGIRALVYAESDSLAILSRTGRDVTAVYPELQGMLSAMHGREAILDGEIVALDKRGQPSFAALQARMNVTNAARISRLMQESPVAFVGFDLLHLDGESRLDAPYRERRGSLESLGLSGPNWHVPPYFEKHGAELLRTSRELGLEGVVCKRMYSSYLPGKRSDSWLKIKHEHIQEVVIGGWRPGEGQRSGTIGSLLVGVFENRKLVYAGRVGTGFGERTLADLQARLAAIERPDSPFAGELPPVDRRGVHWVEPQLVGEARFGEWTADGRLRQPVWRGLRPDKRPREVKRESWELLS
jgi:bifunctional non-homologous end joining protein LigD